MKLINFDCVCMCVFVPVGIVIIMHVRIAIMEYTYVHVYGYLYILTCRYCIKRGTLLDNPTVSPFVNPELHSVHCLVDVKQCEKSGYEVMSLEKIKDGKHGRAFRLDASSNERFVEYARANGLKGRCTTCTGTTEENRLSTLYETGFRAFFVAQVSEEATGSRPAVINVMNFSRASSTGETPASRCSNPEYNAEPQPVYFFETNFHHFIYAHASMMIIGWGTLLPLGVIIAKLGRHLEPNGLWFKIHRPLQITGLCFAIVGWIIALSQFNALEYGTGDRTVHTYMGMLVMTMGLLQPINAFCRPHIYPDQEKTTARFWWEVLHKSFGYIAVLLAIVVISIGTTILPRPEDPKKFQMAYGIGSGLILLSTTIYLLYTYKQTSDTNTDTNTNTNDKKDSSDELNNEEDKLNNEKDDV